MNLTTLTSNAFEKGRVMDFYIYLLLAFGLGLVLRPIFLADRPRDDLCYDDYYCKFFQDDPYD